MASGLALIITDKELEEAWADLATAAECLSKLKNAVVPSSSESSLCVLATAFLTVLGIIETVVVAKGALGFEEGPLGSANLG